MRDYRRKEVKGLLVDVRTMKAYPSMVTVQMTSDKIGESLSLGAEQWLISIPLESVKDIIKVAIRQAESEDKDADKKCTYKETGCGSCEYQTNCPY